VINGEELEIKERLWIIIIYSKVYNISCLIYSPAIGYSEKGH
jgi:hypothetical protein